MYVNTLISLQENIPTYGVEGKTVTGHVTISTPGIIRCYVQNLKQTNNRTFELYVLSSKQDTGVRIGELGKEKETKWRVDEHSVMGSNIALKDIDGVAIIVKENELRGVDAILLGFKNERFTVLPILESIVPKSKPVESVVNVKKETTSPLTTAEPDKTKEVSQSTIVSEERKPVIISNEQEQEPEPMIISNKLEQGPGPVIMPNKPEQGPGPVIMPNKPEQGPGPVIMPNKPEQGPGPVILPNKPEQGPGPVILPNKPEQGPGPVIMPNKPEQGPGPVIMPNKPEQGPGPVIMPNKPGQCPLPNMPEDEPGPVIISEDELETVRPNSIKVEELYVSEVQKDSLSEEIKRSKEAIDRIAEKLKMIKSHSETATESIEIEEREEEQEDIWHLESDRHIEGEEDSTLKVEETPEEIDYLAEIEKKLQEIQGRLKEVRSNGDEIDDDEDTGEDASEAATEASEEAIGDGEGLDEGEVFEETGDNETLKQDYIDLERLEIRRTESAIGDILKKVESLRRRKDQKRSSEENSDDKEAFNSDEVEEIKTENIIDKEYMSDEDEESKNAYDSSKPLGVSKGEIDNIYARGEMVEAFIQEPEDTEWVKISYGDFLRIPNLSYEWCTQPFITFAFYKYNEILLGHNGNGNYYLGIPDIYHPERQAILSDPIPVERFLCRRNIEPAIGEYGYWIIPLQGEYRETN